jgi:uncharacterized protein
MFMPNEILVKTIDEVATLELDRVEFSWHGGEPLLAGQAFYKEALELQQRRMPTATKVKNSLQTNGTLITDDWVDFIVDYKFGVGVSIDGPEDIHNANRPFRVSRLGSFGSVMRGILALQAKGYDVHVIPVVTSATVHKAAQIFDFFVSNGMHHFAFTPCFPKCPPGELPSHDLTNCTVTAEDFGGFMIDIYDIWMRLDDPNISIRFLREITKMLLGGRPSLCVFRKSQLCYRFLTIDSNGDIYPCDSYMAEDFLLGNIRHDTLKEVLTSSRYERFRENVIKVSDDCKSCAIYAICGGGCSLYRYFETRDFRNRSYYCQSMKMLVDHIANQLSGVRGGE